MKIRTRQIIPNVLQLTFEDRYELAMSFVRIQEYYESPKFRGKRFSLEEFIDYWAKEYGNGSFDYPLRWSGFNIPGEVLVSWFQLNKDSLREKEADLISKILKRFDQKDWPNIYVIGVSKDSSNVKEIVDHEVAHAMYKLSDDYRKSCNDLIAKLESTPLGGLIYKEMKNNLLKMGYCEEVLGDEMQAYWSVPNDRRLQAECDILKEIEDNYKEFRTALKGK